MFGFGRNRRRRALLTAITAKKGLSEIQPLLNKVADLETPTETGWTFLLEAVASGNTQVVQALLNAGADANVVCSTKVDPSDFAWDSAFRSMGSQAGVDPYRKNGWTAIMEASSKGDVGSVRHLVNVNAIVDAKTASGGTALMEAAMNGHSDVMKILIDSGAQVDAQNKDGWTALFHASSQGHIEAVHVLIEAGADVSKKNRSNATPLMWAVRSNVPTVRALLDAGASMDDKSNKGGSALMAAIMLRNKEIVGLLCEYGAGTKSIDKDGHSAADIAEMSGSEEILEIVRNSSSTR